MIACHLHGGRPGKAECPHGSRTTGTEGRTPATNGCHLEGFFDIHYAKGKTIQRLVINESEDGPGCISVILDFEDKTDLEVRL
jgi:hypothetical protein